MRRISSITVLSIQGVISGCKHQFITFVKSPSVITFYCVRVNLSTPIFNSHNYALLISHSCKLLQYGHSVSPERSWSRLPKPNISRQTLPSKLSLSHPLAV
ncbi:hypothetical protein AMTRI_Chr11g95440 [Amborella trichopoda]